MGRIAKRSVLAFYRDQGTHHAAALTYYALMSLFPTLLLAVSLLGVLGEYPDTYNAIIDHLRGVVPATTLAPLNDAVRAALKNKGTAAVSLGVAKGFRITERLHARFESTFTNVLNHTNFAPPVTNISNPSSFGALNTAQTAESAGNRTG